jgi:hypothetical protein
MDMRRCRKAMLGRIKSWPGVTDAKVVEGDEDRRGVTVIVLTAYLGKHRPISASVAFSDLELSRQADPTMLISQRIQAQLDQLEAMVEEASHHG